MPLSRRLGSKDVILWWHLLGVGRPYLPFSPSFVPASLLFSLALRQRGPDAALLGSSCDGNLSSWACAPPLSYASVECTSAADAASFMLRACPIAPQSDTLTHPLGEPGRGLLVIGGLQRRRGPQGAGHVCSARRCDSGLSLSQAPIEFETRHCFCARSR